MSETETEPLSYQQGCEAEHQALEMALADEMEPKQLVYLDSDESDIALRRAETAAALVQILYRETILDSVLMSNVSSAAQLRRLIKKRVREHVDADAYDGRGYH